MLDYREYGFFRVASVCPELSLANPSQNVRKIKELLQHVEVVEASVVVFPELCLTGYSCEDLFYSFDLLEASELALMELVEFSKIIQAAFVVGGPYLSRDGRLWNCAFVIQGGMIHGAVPKVELPNYQEFYESRWFSSARPFLKGGGFEANLKQKIKFWISPNQIFQMGSLRFAIEICEDLWSVVPPSCQHALAGAHLILNLSASNEWASSSNESSKALYRKNLVQNQSSRLHCAYVYSSSGVFESSKDLVYGGHLLIAEDGKLLSEGRRFQFQDEMIVTEVDLEALLQSRMISRFYSSDPHDACLYRTCFLNQSLPLSSLKRSFSPTPFLPEELSQSPSFFSEILEIQKAGLKRRVLSSKMQGVIVGLSGGLDSTLAFYIALQAVGKENVLAVSMPGLGTTEQTRQCASDLAKFFGTKFLEIPIHQAIKQHFKDLEQDEQKIDLVYENAQARERTQILFDLANRDSLLVLGTGDLSELALGWCTYNGDHMSGYHVNASIPKTLVRCLIHWIAEQESHQEVQSLLLKILENPISPELVPLDAYGKTPQKTEEILGPYELHDFFLYYFLKNGFSKKKILLLANLVFAKKYGFERIERAIHLFFKRFYTQQYKRSCLPPGPKATAFSLSPRGQWRMPDESYEQ